MSRSKRNSSIIKKYIFFITPIIAMSMAAISIMGYQYTKEELITNLENQMTLLAEKTATSINSLFIKERALAQSFAKAAENIQKERYTAENYNQLLVKFVETYPETAGMGIWFKENAFPDIKKAAPYAYRDGGSIVASDEYTTNDFNIWTSEWYQIGTADQNGGWTKAYKDAVSGISMVTISYPLYDRAKGSLLGCVTADVDISSIKKTVDSMDVSHGGVPFLISNTGLYLAGVANDKIMVEKAQDRNPEVAQIVNSILKENNSGFFEMKKEGKHFFLFYAPVKEANWYIVIRFEQEKIFSSLQGLLNFFIIITITSIIVLILIIFFFTRTVVIRPIDKITVQLEDIAEGEGDLTVRIKTTSKDEIGKLAFSFNTFMEKLQDIITSLSKNTTNVDDASRDLTIIATKLSSRAQDTSDRANNVATATEELSANVSTVAVAMEQSTTNANMVGSASEEMSATISQIVGNVEEAAQISDSAVQQAEKTVEKMEDLEQATTAITKITETITDISDKTNLLALNATIEAARAGEAGKGFTVVANEIKELAAQTVDATNDIKSQIEGIQKTSHSSITAIGEIVNIINKINNIINTITIAVSEQSATTQEIASNISQASRGLAEINENVNQSAAISGEISSDIAQVSEAANEFAQGSSNLTSHAQALQELSAQLKGIVNTFKI